MMDPVVLSKYGKRPLLEVPAMHVEASTANMEIRSLQDALVPQSNLFRSEDHGFGQPPEKLSLPRPNHNFVDASGKTLDMSYKPHNPLIYPGVHSPYVNAFPPQDFAVPSMPTNFYIEGILEYGVLTTISNPNKTSFGRSIPDFLVKELQMSYGMYPKTHFRMISQNGEYFIYATPQNEKDDIYSMNFGDNATQPTVGFNDIRGGFNDIRGGFNDIRGQPK